MRTMTKALTTTEPAASLTLNEWEEREVAISAVQAEELQTSFKHAVEVTPGTAGRYRLRCRHTVGVVRIQGLELRVQPKCPVPNLLYMLSVVYELAKPQPWTTGYQRVEQMWDYLIAMLVGQVEALVTGGLWQGYQEREEDLRALRGRLSLEVLVRRPPGRELRLPCRFEELTHDLPHNQVLRFTLDSLGPPAHPETRLRRLRLLRLLATAAALRHFSPPDLDHLDYNRLNEHYRSAHNLCKLLLAARGLSHLHGGEDAGSYLFNMYDLFERFMARRLRALIPPPLRLSFQYQDCLDVTHQVPIRPDLVLLRGRRPVLVADTKYKLSTDSKPSRGDVYQILAYCRALGVHDGVLLFPDWRGPPRRFTVRDGANQILLDGVDITRPAEQVGMDMSKLARRLTTTG